MSRGALPLIRRFAAPSPRKRGEGPSIFSAPRPTKRGEGLSTSSAPRSTKRGEGPSTSSAPRPAKRGEGPSTFSAPRPAKRGEGPSTFSAPRPAKRGEGGRRPGEGRRRRTIALTCAFFAGSLFGQSVIMNNPGNKPAFAIRNATIVPVTSAPIPNGTIVFD